MCGSGLMVNVPRRSSLSTSFRMDIMKHKRMEMELRFCTDEFNGREGIPTARKAGGALVAHR